jgi:hypothetical protein
MERSESSGEFHFSKACKFASHELAPEIDARENEFRVCARELATGEALSANDDDFTPTLQCWLSKETCGKNPSASRHCEEAEKLRGPKKGAFVFAF